MNLELKEFKARQFEINPTQNKSKTCIILIRIHNYINCLDTCGLGLFLGL